MSLYKTMCNKNKIWSIQHHRNIQFFYIQLQIRTKTNNTDMNVCSRKRIGVFALEIRQPTNQFILRITDKSNWSFKIQMAFFIAQICKCYLFSTCNFIEKSVSTDNCILHRFINKTTAELVTNQSPYSITYNLTISQNENIIFI